MTLSGRPVVSGVYRFHETHGFPLDLLIEESRAHDIIDWLAFRAEARVADVTDARLVQRLQNAVPASLLAPLLEWLVALP